MYLNKSIDGWWMKIQKSNKNKTFVQSNIGYSTNRFEVYVVYVDNYYGGLDLVEDTSNKRFNFTFNCRANKPSWLFVDGLHKDMSEYERINKFVCWVHKDKSILI